MKKFFTIVLIISVLTILVSCAANLGDGDSVSSEISERELDFVLLEEQPDDAQLVCEKCDLASNQDSIKHGSGSFTDEERIGEVKTVTMFDGAVYEAEYHYSYYLNKSVKHEYRSDSVMLAFDETDELVAFLCSDLNKITKEQIQNPEVSAEQAETMFKDFLYEQTGINNWGESEGSLHADGKDCYYFSYYIKYNGIKTYSAYGTMDILGKVIYFEISPLNSFNDVPIPAWDMNVFIDKIEAEFEVHYPKESYELIDTEIKSMYLRYYPEEDINAVDIYVRYTYLKVQENSHEDTVLEKFTYYYD